MNNSIQPQDTAISVHNDYVKKIIEAIESHELAIRQCIVYKLNERPGNHCVFVN